MGSSGPPDVLFAVDEGQARVGEVVAAVAVDLLDFGGCRDTECFTAYYGCVV